MMDRKTLKSERPPCPYCRSSQISKNGSTHQKKTKFICKDCGRQFIKNPQKKIVNEREKQQVKKLLLERISLQGIVRCLGLSMAWLQKFVDNLYQFSPRTVKALEISDLEIEVKCDELWSYVNSKEIQFMSG